MNAPTAVRCPGCLEAADLVARANTPTSCSTCGQPWEPDAAQPAPARVYRRRTYVSLGCERCPVFQALAARFGMPSRCRCGAVWDPGDAAPEPAPERRRRPTPANALLALLRDCARIAQWDAVASAPPTGVSRTSEGNVGGGARTERTDRPDWHNDAHDQVARAGRLRARLERIWSQGRRESARALAAWEARMATRVPWEPPPGPSEAARAAAVIEWLVPRARVLLDSAASQKRSPIERDLPRELGLAFATGEQRAQWAPPYPAPPVAPAYPARPAVPVPPSPPGAFVAPEDPSRAHFARLEHEAALREYAEGMRTYTAASREYPRALERWKVDLVNYPAAMRAHAQAEKAHKDLVREHPAALKRGLVGRAAHGNDLLRLAERVWFAMQGD